jgi:DNA-binding beta-propeller fold protein YncE
VLDGATNSTDTVRDPNAIHPGWVAVNPATNKIYVENGGAGGGYEGSNNVTVIDGAGKAPGVALKPSRLPFLLLRTVGSGELDISGITLTGPDPGDFAQSNNCPPSVPSGGSCLNHGHVHAHSARSAHSLGLDHRQRPGSP